MKNYDGKYGKLVHDWGAVEWTMFYRDVYLSRVRLMPPDEEIAIVIEEHCGVQIPVLFEEISIVIEEHYGVQIPVLKDVDYNLVGELCEINSVFDEFFELLRAYQLEKIKPEYFSFLDQHFGSWEEMSHLVKMNGKYMMSHQVELVLDT